MAACTTNVQVPPVQVKSSTSLVLPNFTAKQRTLYIEPINQGFLDNINLVPQLTKALQKKGYILVASQSEAAISLQINIVKTGKLNIARARALLTSDYGGSTDFNDLVLSHPGNNLYVIAADIQISQRLQGNNVNVYWNRYQTRMCAQMPTGHLTFEQAQGRLINRLVYSIVNFFGR